MGVNYANVNPQSSMSLDLFSGPDISLVNNVVSDLQAGQPVTPEALNKSTRILEAQRGHVLHGGEYSEIIETIYALSDNPEMQAQVMGNLISPQNMDLVKKLLGLPENPLAHALGTSGTATLVDAAAGSSSHERNIFLIQSAQEHLGRLPQTYQDAGVLEKKVTEAASGEDISGWLAANLLQELQMENLATAESMLGSLSEGMIVDLAGQVAVAGGESIRPALNELMESSNPNTSRFAYSTLVQLGKLGISQEGTIALDDTRGDLQSHKDIDLSALESLLMAPQNTPATLSIQLSGVPNLHTQLISLLIR